MGDYLITMDTGEQFIAHHGVKGQKWGKWNPETLARYNGLKVNPSGGGSIDIDEDDEEENSEHVESDFSSDMKKVALEALNKLTNSGPGWETRKAVNDTVKSALVADVYKRNGDRLSESERADLRQKAYEEKKERVRKRRENARESGNPLWMFV